MQLERFSDFFIIIFLVLEICDFLRDPYEQRYVYVKESFVPFAGEGLFAKQKIKVKIMNFI